MIAIKKHKSFKKIVREWDEIASLRETQVKSGRDHSANFVLAPAILGEIPRDQSVIDIGCGTGWLTSRVAQFSREIVGIDPSQKSISIAQLEHHAPKIHFSALSVEQYSELGQTFDVAISNMAASSSPDLGSFIAASRKVLKKQGVYVITIPHPCFWPMYWGYVSDPNFKYQKSFAVEANFKIQNESSCLVTTHFHHPIEHYTKVLSDSGFRIDSIKELTGRGFSLPRFMLIKSRAI